VRPKGGVHVSGSIDIESDLLTRAVAEIARSKKRLHNLRAYV
jgi:hypothetical protein